MYDFCEGLFFLKAALDRASALTPDGLAAAVADLRDSYDGVKEFTGGTRFTVTRHDAVRLVRDFRFDMPKNTFVYSSPVYAAQ
jgi:hypothetical protein